MGRHIDIGYFKKPVKVRAKVAKDNVLKNFTSELMAKNYFNHFMQNLH